MLRRKLLRRLFGVVALIAILIPILLIGFSAIAKAEPPPLTLNVKSAILLDFATGQVLYTKDADAPIPPASLTKLMTLHLAYKKIAEGAIKKEDKVRISERAWAAKMLGSSVMFLEPGQNVTVGEIMKGIAIPSGNDASNAIAEHISGSIDAFVSLMNKEAQDMGFTTMKFTDPAGLNPTNIVTAREFAEFARRYVAMHPEALPELHSVVEFTYPLPVNLPADKKGTPSVTQYNRNTLLGNIEGVDGLKTGFIEESGYNIALTAKRGETRLVAVILGAPGKNDVEGSRNRAEAGSAILQWGFANFTTAKPAVPTIAPVRVWKGAANEVALEPDRPVLLTVAKGQETKLIPTVHQEASVTAPVKKGDKLGELIYSADGKEIAKFNLLAKEEIKQGNFFKRLWDTIRLTVTGWFNRKK
ncbi:MAG TPA: D-alanyl-D-alanine carboxypeptidase family protein [Symbiobacteriaceae bacterium]|nr:D-alanyl-D-alanine carboxypeptidase family protein [Symbiobacteriaceae bacterium]